MPDTYILSLDLGTTGNRAICFDKNQRIVSHAYQEFPQIYPKPGWVEHNPDAIWKSVHDILKKTFRRVSINKISATGYAEFRPIADNATPEGRAKNRRVDIVMLSGEAERGEP